jgi:hypothetical protein
VRNDAGISQFGDDAIGEIAGAFACAAREQHDITGLECRLQRCSERVEIVPGNPEARRLAAKLPHGVSEHLRVRVVDFRRLHGLAGSDDLVAGRKDGDDRLSPDVDSRHADGGQDAGIAAGERLTTAQHRLAAGDVRSGERHAAPRRNGPGNPQIAAVDLRVFDHDHGIGAARNHPAGGNLNRRARPNDRRRHDARVNRFLGDRNGPWHLFRSTERVFGHDGKAIDVRAIEGRHVYRRDHIGGQDASEGGIERHRLDRARCQIESGAKAPLRLVAIQHVEELLLLTHRATRRRRWRPRTLRCRRGR